MSTPTASFDPTPEKSPPEADALATNDGSDSLPDPLPPETSTSGPHQNPLSAVPGLNTSGPHQQPGTI